MRGRRVHHRTRGSPQSSLWRGGRWGKKAVRGRGQSSTTVAPPFVGGVSSQAASTSADRAAADGRFSLPSSPGEGRLGVAIALASIDHCLCQLRGPRLVGPGEGHVLVGAALRARGPRHHPRRLHHREPPDADPAGGGEHLWRHGGERLRALWAGRGGAAAALAQPLCGRRARAPLRRDAQAQRVRTGVVVPRGAGRGVRRLRRLRLDAGLARPLHDGESGGVGPLPAADALSGHQVRRCARRSYRPVGVADPVRRHRRHQLCAPARICVSRARRRHRGGRRSAGRAVRRHAAADSSRPQGGGRRTHSAGSVLSAVGAQLATAWP